VWGPLLTSLTTINYFSMLFWNLIPSSNRVVILDVVFDFKTLLAVNVA
jgi:hypothetical protein